MKRYLVPALIVVAVVALLVATGMARKDAGGQGWLGVYAQSVDYDLAEKYDLETRYGALVDEIVEDSPADKAGLREDDVIIAFNNEKVTDADDLVDLLVETAPGDKVNLTIVRNGKEQTIAVEVGETPERKTIWRNGPGDRHVMVLPKVSRAYVGVFLDNLTEQLGDYFGVPEGEGALITEVEDDSPAQKAGLKAGDVIVEIDGEKILDADDVSDLLADHKEGDKVNFTVVRNQRSNQITVEVAAREDSFFDNGFMYGPDQAVINIPHLRGMFHGNFPGKADFDAEFNDEFEREMRQLAEEMAQLKIEMHDVGDIDIDREDVRRDLEELRRELRELKRQMESDLRELNERLQ